MTFCDTRNQKVAGTKYRNMSCCHSAIFARASARSMNQFSFRHSSRNLPLKLSDYVSYYNEDRTHLGLEKQPRLVGHVLWGIVR